MIDRRNLIGLGGGVAAMALVRPAAARAPAAADAAGRVTTLAGRASAIAAAGPERPLALNDPVQVAELVQTAAESRLGLRLGRSTIVNLGPATRLRLDPHLLEAGGTFELVEGSMLFEHVRPRGSPPGKAEVKSPYGLIAVRGTRFWAGISRGSFGVFVTEGRVDVTAAGRTVALLPGWGTDITAPGQPPGPVRAWPVARQREVYQLTLGHIPR